MGLKDNAGVGSATQTYILALFHINADESLAHPMEGVVGEQVVCETLTHKLKPEVSFLSGVCWFVDEDALVLGIESLTLFEGVLVTVVEIANDFFHSVSVGVLERRGFVFPFPPDCYAKLQQFLGNSKSGTLKDVNGNNKNAPNSLPVSGNLESGASPFGVYL